ncbi:MAG: ATP synthase F1 subunit gamma [Gemmatimonadota bacterium]
MSKAREIKRRIRSVDNTRQITRTMEMVATSKLKRAADRVYAARPYGDALEEIVESLYDPQLAGRFPLLRRPDQIRRSAILLLTANRGLAGAFNVNLIRKARGLMEKLRAEGQQVELHVSGKKGIAFFRFQEEELAASWTEIDDKPMPEDAATLVGDLQRRFEEEELDQVWVVASEFRSAMSTPPTVRELLPIRPGARETTPENSILEPSGEVILDKLLPLYIRNVVYRALAENTAAEQGARRTAMKNATDNASDMLDDLRRTYNRVRQAHITQEIAEIVGGAAAFE